jgi:tetratricopeptide (TPR) repeat protein
VRRDKACAIGPTFTLASRFPLTQAGRYEEAFQQADDSHRLFVDLGLDRSTVGLGAINNRAVAAMHLGRFEQATADFQVIHDILGELYGESPQLAAAQNNLALSLIRQERFEQARPLLESALRTAVAKDGEHGRSTMMPRINLAETLVKLGQLDQARPLADAAVSIGVGTYGNDSPFAGLAHRARANLRAAQGDLDGARDDLHRAIAVFNAMGAGGADYLRGIQPLRERLGIP